MAISLNSKTQQLIEKQMKDGGYSTPDEVVRVALTTLGQQDPLSQLGDADVESLHPGFREKIAQGLAEANAGKVSDGEEFFAELEREERLLLSHRLPSRPISH
ncbi:MAG TPA: hypothetical protein VFC78_00145 [Tepidisphaeraceae bacterium]|nr:hypothetical protein [Tepidisphaeraceae bacterium]